MNDQNQILTPGPHNYLVKVARHAKTDQASSHDERVLTRYVGELGEPSSPSDNYGNADALKSSYAVGSNLALAKISHMRGDHAKVSKHLDATMEHHAELHAGIHAAARQSEIDPMRIREKQD